MKYAPQIQLSFLKEMLSDVKKCQSEDFHWQSFI